MKNKSIIASATVLALSLFPASPVSADVGSEDPFDPCFSAVSGYFSRTYETSVSYQESNSVNGWATSSEISRSGNLYRGNYYYSSSITRGETLGETYQIFYDGANGVKTVDAFGSIYTYFTLDLFVDFVGYLVGDNGENIAFTSWVDRQFGGDGGVGERTLPFPRTQTIERNCSGFGSNPGIAANQIFEIELDPSTSQTFSVTALSGRGSQLVQISVEPGSVLGKSKLLVVNDPFSIQNEFGFGSLGFKLVDENNNPTSLLGPIEVLMQERTDAKLAYSSDAKDWTYLGEGISNSLGLSIVSESESSFLLSGTSSSDWLFVGQKKGQESQVIYANRFSVPLGSNALVTTTGGSGKGVVSFFSNTPKVCDFSGNKTFRGISLGTCRITAIKAGFDGYVDAKTQVIRLEIVK